MCEAIGHPVMRLVRTRIGPITDRSLRPGDYRELSTGERRALAEAVADPARRYDQRP
jgi:23S rRNA pseudouridine2605 synthase